jgi:HlyD family secretion protein
MDGIVTYLNAEAGEIAQAQTSYTQGKRLMTIADLSVFEVEVDVDETEIAKIKIGQYTKIRVDAFRDTSFAGTVVEIGNSARVEGQGSENYSTNFMVKIRFEETETAVRPGMSATVDITTATLDEALLIPYAAVIVREFHPDSLAELGLSDESDNSSEEIAAADADNAVPPPNGDHEEKSDARGRKKIKRIKKSGVYVVKDGLAKFTEITTGIADESNVVALTGVNPGDTVISGSFQTLRKLSNGDEVRIDENSLEQMREDEG